MSKYNISLKNGHILNKEPLSSDAAEAVVSMLKTCHIDVVKSMVSFMKKGETFLCTNDYYFDDTKIFTWGHLYTVVEDNELITDVGRPHRFLSEEAVLSGNFFKIDKNLKVGITEFTEWYFDYDTKNDLGIRLVEKLIEIGNTYMSITGLFYHECEYIPLRLVNNLPKEIMEDEDLVDECEISPKLVTLIQ